MSKFLKEFKEFAVKGNVVDLAVAVIIGGAFGKIVSSLVADIVMPPLGVLMGGVNFSDIKIVLKEAVISGSMIVKPTITLNIGNFLQNVLDFLIIALTVFVSVKVMSRVKKRLEPALRSEKAIEEKIAPLTKDQELLAEIRDLLKK
ncbi:MAG: large-conductance mechanosensitive channel protein MscL [Patescibacteria group bacterium]|jgi:large conductance mechanosensitive channel